jgi:hypothetical protein
MLPDTGIDDVKKKRNAEYTKHINDPVLSSLKMEGIRLLSFCTCVSSVQVDAKLNSVMQNLEAASTPKTLEQTLYAAICKT